MSDGPHPNPPHPEGRPRLVVPPPCAALQEPEEIAPGVPASSPGPPVAARVGRRPKPRAKTGKLLLFMVGGALLVLSAVFLFLKSGSKKRDERMVASLIQEAAAPGRTTLDVNPRQLDLLLQSAASAVDVSKRGEAIKALGIASLGSGVETDERIARFAAGIQVSEAVRGQLLNEVLVRRANPDVVPVLLEIAETSKDPRVLEPVMKTCRPLAREEHLEQTLKLLGGVSDESAAKSVEDVAGSIIDHSKHSVVISSLLAQTYESAKSSAARQVLIRLLGHCGGDKAQAIVKSALTGGDSKIQRAAVQSIGYWPDVAATLPLIRALKRCEDQSLRNEGFQSAFRALSQATTKPDAATAEKLWKALADLARSDEQIVGILQHLGRTETDAWAAAIVHYFRKNEGGDVIIDAADAAVRSMIENYKVVGK